MHPEQYGGPHENSSPENKPHQTFNFYLEGKTQVVSFVETMHVAKGVDCEVYAFVEDESKDLGIIKIDPGKKTPLQRVLQGEKTVEGYLSGKGKLTVTKPDGQQEIYTANGSPIVVTVGIGETMQWEADPDSSLVAFEICTPPYQDGRFENIG